MDGLEENIHPLNTYTSLLSILVKSFTWIYAVISGSSPNSEFLHFKLLIDRSLYVINSPFYNLSKVFLELILSNIFISVLNPSKLFWEIELFISKK